MAARSPYAASPGAASPTVPPWTASPRRAPRRRGCAHIRAVRARTVRPPSTREEKPSSEHQTLWLMSQHTRSRLKCPLSVRQGSSAATSDLNAHAARLLALGFNAVRLPFSFARLLDAALPAPVVITCTAASPVQLQAHTPFMILLETWHTCCGAHKHAWRRSCARATGGDMHANLSSVHLQKCEICWRYQHSLESQGAELVQAVMPSSAAGPVLTSQHEHAKAAQAGICA